MCLTCEKIIIQNVVISCGLYFSDSFICDEVAENAKNTQVLNILFWTLTIALEPVTINLKKD